ncbi:MAG: hypothetical protein KAV18_01255 [Candidatus Omnitrophica bacterium]|nr:hypothetical protein [Candidatus Omnitrophota bacterium]
MYRLYHGQIGYIPSQEKIGADLRGADLTDACLRGAKNYSDNHDFCVEIIKRQKIEVFTEKEWAVIAQIYIYKLCWESIEKRYGKKILPIFKKIADFGFPEYLEKCKEEFKK